MKMNKNISLCSIHLRNMKGEQYKVQGDLLLAEANLGYYLGRFQSLQLPSTQSEILKANSHIF
jgi:hypothetical protein